MKHILSFIIILLFYSCTSINYITIDVREPARVSFPPEVANVLIVDNSPTPDEEKNSEQTGLGILSLDSTRTIFLKALCDYMNEEAYFSKVELYPTKINTSKTLESTRPLTRNRVRTICRDQNADAVISLDFFSMVAQLETVNVAYFENYNVLGTRLGSIFRVYSGQGEQYVQPMGYIDSLFREEHRDWSRLKNNIGEVNSLIVEMATVGADRMTAQFIPSWKFYNRWYYIFPGAQMKVASKCAKEGKWADAANAWRVQYDNEREGSKKKIMLASNIALANECLDDIENAVEWIEIAYDMLPQNNKSEFGKEIITYKYHLLKRKENQPKLYEQLGLEYIVEEDEEWD